MCVGWGVHWALTAHVIVLALKHLTHPPVTAAYEGLQEAHLVGFTEVEVQSLLKLVAKLPYPDSLP